MGQININTYLTLEQKSIDVLSIKILELIKKEAGHPVCYIEIKTILDRADELIDFNTYLK